MVKSAPANAMLELAGRYLKEEFAAASHTETPAACCGDDLAQAGEAACCAPVQPAPAKPELAVAAPACDPSTGCCGG
jgi:hypothetical protein